MVYCVSRIAYCVACGLFPYAIRNTQYALRFSYLPQHLVTKPQDIQKLTHFAGPTLPVERVVRPILSQFRVELCRDVASKLLERSPQLPIRLAGRTALFDPLLQAADDCPSRMDTPGMGGHV